MAKKVSPRKSATGKVSKAGKGGKGGKKAVKKAAAKPVAKGGKVAKAAASVKPARKAPAKAAKGPVKPKKSAKAPAKLAKLKKLAERILVKSPSVAKFNWPVHPPLTKEELKEFRKLLLAKRRELVGDMTGLEAEALGADRQESKGDISDHPADAGTDNFEQEFSLGLLESERKILAEIDQSIIRLEHGTYGICLGTGKPIGKARLVARPWAPYGIEYARMVEKGLVRAGERIVTDEEPDEEDEDAEVEPDYEPEDGGSDRDDDETGFGE